MRRATRYAGYRLICGWWFPCRRPWPTGAMTRECPQPTGCLSRLVPSAGRARDRNVESVCALSMASGNGPGANRSPGRRSLPRARPPRLAMTWGRSIVVLMPGRGPAHDGYGVDGAVGRVAGRGLRHPLERNRQSDVDVEWAVTVDGHPPPSLPQVPLGVDSVEQYQVALKVISSSPWCRPMTVIRWPATDPDRDGPGGDLDVTGGGGHLPQDSTESNGMPMALRRRAAARVRRRRHRGPIVGGRRRTEPGRSP